LTAACVYASDCLQEGRGFLLLLTVSSQDNGLSASKKGPQTAEVSAALQHAVMCSDAAVEGTLLHQSFWGNPKPWGEETLKPKP